MENKKEPILSPFMQQEEKKVVPDSPVFVNKSSILTQEVLDKIKELTGYDSIFIITNKKYQNGLVTNNQVDMATEGWNIEILSQFLEQIIKNFKKPM